MCDCTVAVCCTTSVVVVVVHCAHDSNNNNNNMIYFYCASWACTCTYNAVDCAIINQREIGKSVGASAGNEYDNIILLYDIARCCC